MENMDMALPLHLYTETTGGDGSVNRITYAADKLVAWAGHGKGDAIEKHCRQVYESDIAAIHAWQEQQFLLLDESWIAVEKGWDDDDNEKQHEIACAAVRSEAKDKYDVAALKMEKRHAAINELVLESKKHLAENLRVNPQGGSSGMMLALAVLGVLAWIFI